MAPSGNRGERGERGEMGECKTHDVAAAMAGLPGGVVSEVEVEGASAFLGGNWKF